MVESPAVYEPLEEETVCETVLRAVADSKDADPTRTDWALYDAVDPDALDAFFDSRADSTGRRVCFTVADRRVVVDESPPASSNPQVLHGAASPWRIVFGNH